MPTPPIGHTALADVSKPPSKARVIPAKSTLTTQTTPVQAPQPVPAPEPVVDTTPAVEQAPDPPAQPTAAIDGCGDNSYANYIYMHESGCVTDRVNAIGCLGIGQACPGSKLTAVCPNLDYACENVFFTNYANVRYGGWAGAYAFWINNHWW